jgi:RNA polymerase sigma factor (sigma-70 family)
MATSQMSGVVKHLRRGAILGNGTLLSDGQLLDCYITDRDEAAFAALVRRHGAMVWGVCRRVLAGHHDAEDAFQAVFLVLARKATSVVPRELVANWLYGVAYNIALKARAGVARRRIRERQVTPMPEPTAVELDLWRDLGPVLDQELNRLPDKYRVPVVLCDLEGKSYKEAAEQLGCSGGTFGARLSRARAILTERLTRRGVTLSAGALALVLSQNAASASVPAVVVSNTIKAVGALAARQAVAGAISAKAAALCEGVVKNMLWTKLRGSVVILAIGALLFGAGLWRYAVASPGSESGSKPSALKSRLLTAQAGKKTDAERFVGTWRIASATADGKEIPEEFRILARMTFTKDGKASLTAAMVNGKEGTYKVLGDGKVDLVLGEGKDLGAGIYKFDGDDKLILCALSKEGAVDRPTQFSGDKDSGQVLFVLVRAKPGEEKPSAEDLAKYRDGLKQMRGAAGRQILASNLRQIGLAFHQFFDKNTELPLHAIYAKDDKTPLLSWRVAILPYTGIKECQDLYKEFKLDEPWDSPHNKKLIAKMPALYAPVDMGTGKIVKAEEGRTYLQVFTGPDSLFDGTRRRKLADITDGLSNTLLVIDAAEPVTWTRPDDVKLPGKNEKMPDVGGQFKNGLIVLLCDGSVHILADVPAPEVLRALATPAGNEEIDWENMKVVPKK